MKRVKQGGDINFRTKDITGLGRSYSIRFFTVDVETSIRKTQADADENGIIRLEWIELNTIGQGVLNFIADSKTDDSEYSDGTYNRTFSGTTEYYIASELVIPDGEDTETIIDAVNNIQNELNAEINRSTNKDAAHDTQISELGESVEDLRDDIANVYTKAEVDDMLDDVDLPDNVVVDANYVHTDNNFTTAYKNVIDGLSDSITTEELTATTSVSTKEMIFTPYYVEEDVPENNKIGLNVAFDEENKRSVFEFYDYYTQAIFRLPIIDGVEFVTTAGFPVEETNAGGSGTTQSSNLIPCTYNVLQVRTTRIRTINFSFSQGNTSYYLLIDRSYLSGFASLTTLNFEDITVTWEGGNAFDLATFRSGTDSYALINLLKISDEVILGSFKLY